MEEGCYTGRAMQVAQVPQAGGMQRAIRSVLGRMGGECVRSCRCDMPLCSPVTATCAASHQHVRTCTLLLPAMPIMPARPACR